MEKYALMDPRGSRYGLCGTEDAAVIGCEPVVVGAGKVGEGNGDVPPTNAYCGGGEPTGVGDLKSGKPVVDCE